MAPLNNLLDQPLHVITKEEFLLLVWQRRRSLKTHFWRHATHNLSNRFGLNTQKVKLSVWGILGDLDLAYQSSTSKNWFYGRNFLKGTIWFIVDKNKFFLVPNPSVASLGHYLLVVHKKVRVFGESFFYKNAILRFLWRTLLFVCFIFQRMKSKIRCLSGSFLAHMYEMNGLIRLRYNPSGAADMISWIPSTWMRFIWHL